MRRFDSDPRLHQFCRFAPNRLKIPFVVGYAALKPRARRVVGLALMSVVHSWGRSRSSPRLRGSALKLILIDPRQSAFIRGRVLVIRSPDHPITGSPDS
jgi:hypothetical protein